MPVWRDLCPGSTIRSVSDCPPYRQNSEKVYLHTVMQRKVTCIINGCRPLKKLLAELLEQVRITGGIALTTYTTTAPKEAIHLAAKACEEGADVVVAVGGDGTCHEVVNGIMRAGKKPVFAFLPNGTGNDFQRMHGTFDPDSWIRALQENRCRQIDLVEVQRGEECTYALNISGIGFDGYVIHLLSRQRTHWKVGGKFSYATAIARAFFTYRKPHLCIEGSDFRYEGKALLAAACNGSTFGHGLVLAPEACIDNGVLEMVVLGDVSLWDYVRNLSRLKRGIPVRHREAHYFRDTEVRVTTDDAGVWCESDGELTGEGSLRFRCVPGALSLLG